MRRWFTLLLLVLMPLQSVWATAAAYCLHEQGGGVQHLGHHADTHREADEATGHGHDHHQALHDCESDCASCHLGGALLLMAAPAAGLRGSCAAGRGAAAPAAALACADPTPIERPNWAAAPQA